MKDILIYGAFTFSMFCVVAYFAIPVIKRLKQARNNPTELPDEETETDEADGEDQ